MGILHYEKRSNGGYDFRTYRTADFEVCDAWGCCGLVFQRIYNFADSYIVGHFLGDNALAAVSVAGVGMYLVFSLIIGLTTGVTVVMSQYYGAKEEDKVVKTFFSSIFIALGMTILVTVIGLLTTRPLLIVLQTPAEVAGCGLFLYLADSFAPVLSERCCTTGFLQSYAHWVIPWFR